MCMHIEICLSTADNYNTICKHSCNVFIISFQIKSSVFSGISAKGWEVSIEVLIVCLYEYISVFLHVCVSVSLHN